MKTKTIKTERLTLRKMHFYDLPYASKWYCSKEVTQFSQGKEIPSFFDFFKFYARTVYHYYLRKNPYSLWAVTLENKMIGFVRCFPLNEGKRHLLYYITSPEFHGKGYTAEAVAAVVEYARDNGAEEICASCDVLNVGSVRVLEKCGLKHIRTDSGAYHYRDGRTGDRAIYIKKLKD